MKSYVWELARLYIVLLQDCMYAYPTLREEFEKDFARIHTLATRRGVHFFVVDLPALGKHLDRCVADGEYKLSGLPGGCRYSRRVVIPKLFRGLYLLIFDARGSLKEDLDVEALLLLRQLLYLAKKARLDCGTEKTDREIEKFISTDHDLPVPEMFWNSESPTEEDFEEATPSFSASPIIINQSQISSEKWSALLRNLDTVSGILTSTLGSYNYRDWRFRHGPGVTSEGGRWRNKYKFRRWSSRLESMFALADCGFHNYASWAGGALQDWDEGEPSSRLIAVPKTFSAPRLIAAEPSEHQWCQQNCWHYFCERVRQTWVGKFVRFNDQTLNQDLCRRSSRDGSLATLDLSEASDRLTCHVVAQVFRGNPTLLRSLQAFRTRELSYTRKGVRQSIKLKKFSTMGSSVTFPVESLVFLCICLASVLTARRLRPTLGNIKAIAGEVAVFGDDLIVPVDSRVLLCDALKNLFLKVNLAKSFWTGKFRESCGLDAYDGVSLTPVYWHAPYKKQPESFASTVDVMNNFYKKFFIQTSAYLASTIHGYNLPSVNYDSGVCGRVAFVPSDVRLTHKVRWNKDLQRQECLVPVIRHRLRHTPIKDDTGLLKFFTEQPDPNNFWTSGVSQRPRSSLGLRWASLSDYCDVQ